MSDIKILIKLLEQYTTKKVLLEDQFAPRKLDARIQAGIDNLKSKNDVYKITELGLNFFDKFVDFDKLVWEVLDTNEDFMTCLGYSQCQYWQIALQNSGAVINNFFSLRDMKVYFGTEFETLNIKLFLYFVERKLFIKTSLE